MSQNCDLARRSQSQTQIVPSEASEPKPPGMTHSTMSGCEGGNDQQKMTVACEKPAELLGQGHGTQVRELSMHLPSMNGEGAGIKRDRTLHEIEERRQTAVKRLSLMDALRPMQRDALKCMEGTENNVIIIMPTGSGKTTLIWTFKKFNQCSIVFAPYKLLVDQLTELLSKHATTFSFPFDDGCDYSAILFTADFIVMPYEAVHSAVEVVTALHRLQRIGPIWLDEVSNNGMLVITECVLYIIEEL
jgi:hypothetical protein